MKYYPKKRYHFCQSVTLTDIFSALGWFIAVADSPAECMGNVDWYLRRLLIYSKFVHTIIQTTQEWEDADGPVEQARLIPTCTSIFFSIYHPPFYVRDLTEIQESSQVPVPHEVPPESALQLVSLGIALPGTRNKNNFRVRREADVKQLDARIATAFQDHHNSRTPPLGQTLGHCAETLNVLSQSMADRWGYVFGTTLDVAMHNRINRLITLPHMQSLRNWMNSIVPPCDNCEFFISTRNLTFMDIGNLSVYGPLPEGYTVPKVWKLQVLNSDSGHGELITSPN
ncbi:hypothetical protein BD410DRAFT_841867 [Rickenella mellea]|uniref:Uncharacterized protein n=1 Tax=Rickenella mellea TaxID=50990 RepID=A0A4Y7PYM5_9AGAM|nr:hypothetical protein BD410DRAFT_841867 [Rickenella mellea]